MSCWRKPLRLENSGAPDQLFRDNESLVRNAVRWYTDMYWNCLTEDDLFRAGASGMEAERHMVSLSMLTFLVEVEFTPKERLNLPEDCFPGRIPDEVKQARGEGTRESWQNIMAETD